MVELHRLLVQVKHMTLTTAMKNELPCMMTNGSRWMIISRFDADLNAGIDSAHRKMVRRMVKLKRKPGETWLDWHKRSFRRAKQAIQSCNCVLSLDLEKRRKAWQQHIVRFGSGPRQNHLLKFLLAWRSSGWWSHQKAQNRGPNKVVHAHRCGMIRRYDANMSWVPIDTECQGN